MLCAVVNPAMLSMPPRRCLRWPLNQRDKGFVLPVTLCVCLVLLLGSASIHTLSLQTHLRHQAELRRHQAADQLRSAGHAFAAQARGAQACLLLWSSRDWGASTAACAGADPERLRGGSLDGKSWRLLSWQPSPGGDSGRLQLALADGRRAGFRLHLDPDSAAVLAVSEVQLQGLADREVAS